MLKPESDHPLLELIATPVMVTSVIGVVAAGIYARAHSNDMVPATHASSGNPGMYEQGPRADARHIPAGALTVRIVDRQQP